MDSRRRLDGAAWIAVVIASLVLFGALVVGGLRFFRTIAGPTALQQAAEACSSGANRVRASDTSLTVASGGEVTPEEATMISACVLRELGAPASVKSKVEGTTPAMGRQTASWDDYELTWTSRPGHGLEIVVKLR